MFAWRGWRGDLRAGGRTAATFGAWSYVRPDATLGDTQGTADLAAFHVVNAVWLGARPLEVWLDCDRAWWVWDVQDLRHGADAAVVTVSGPPRIRRIDRQEVTDGLDTRLREYGHRQAHAG